MMNDQDAETIKHLREQLLEYKTALRLGYEVYEMLMPGAAHIAVQDYAALNTFGVKARALLNIKGDNDGNGEDSAGHRSSDAGAGSSEPADGSGIDQAG